MQAIQQFLQGKKTYISAAALCMVAVSGFLFGYIGGTEATALLSAAGALAGLGAKSQRTAQTIIAELRQVQAAAASGQKIDPKAFAADLSKQLMSQFAAGGIVRSTPAGAVSNVVPLSVETIVPPNLKPATCMFCNQPLTYGGGVCDSPLNNTEPLGSGKRLHVVAVVVPAGSTAR
jgi:hypothetical protein